MTISQVISQFLAVLGKGSCGNFAQGLIVTGQQWREGLLLTL